MTFSEFQIQTLQLAISINKNKKKIEVTLSVPFKSPVIAKRLPVRIIPHVIGTIV